MDINDFIPTIKKPEPTPIIQKDIDAAKYDAVAAKLCEKRKKLEDHLAEAVLTDEDRAETLIEVARLRDSMKMFGITEIDYQAYIAYKASETGVQLELF
jgi:hypothetical protein